MSSNPLDERVVKIRTTCKSCVFAQFNNEVTEQIGCELGRLSIFQDRGLAELKVDEETQFKHYEINKFCNACRNLEWSNKFEDPIKSIEKEIQIKVDVVIIDQEDKLNNVVVDDWLEKIKESIDSATNQTIKPSKIVVGFYQKTHSFKYVIEKLDSTGIRNEIVNVLKNCHRKGDFLDEVIKKCPNQYYILCELGKTLPSNYIEKLNTLINAKLESVSMIEPLDGLTGTTVQTLLHNKIMGNNNVDVQDKIKELANNQLNTSAIKQWNQL